MQISLDCILCVSGTKDWKQRKKRAIFESTQQCLSIYWRLLKPEEESKPSPMIIQVIPAKLLHIQDPVQQFHMLDIHMFFFLTLTGQVNGETCQWKKNTLYIYWPGIFLSWWASWSGEIRKENGEELKGGANEKKKKHTHGVVGLQSHPTPTNILNQNFIIVKILVFNSIFSLIILFKMYWIFFNTYETILVNVLFFLFHATFFSSVFIRSNFSFNAFVES